MKSIQKLALFFYFIPGIQTIFASEESTQKKEIQINSIQTIQHTRTKYPKTPFGGCSPERNNAPFIPTEIKESNNEISNEQSTQLLEDQNR